MPWLHDSRFSRQESMIHAKTKTNTSQKKQTKKSLPSQRIPNLSRISFTSLFALPHDLLVDGSGHSLTRASSICPHARHDQVQMFSSFSISYDISSTTTDARPAVSRTNRSQRSMTGRTMSSYSVRPSRPWIEGIAKISRCSEPQSSQGARLAASGSARAASSMCTRPGRTNQTAIPFLRT